MFIDEAKVNIRAGDGGNGCESLYRDRVNRIGKPDGGPGGKGGDVIFEADQNVQTLLDFHYRQHFRADSGEHGSSNHKKGAWGKDLVVKVPPGTIIRDPDTGLVLRDLSHVGDRVVIARGGAGGRGNSRGRSATYGLPGEERAVSLELKMIADVGIVGYPNAGKSTLISAISRARPKIASYPFTTKEPSLGVAEMPGGVKLVVADIPGLIEGAHKGRGLGHRFLRHLERTRGLIHLIDVASIDGRDPHSDYVKLNKELKLYSPDLAKKPQVVALNKIDCEGAREAAKGFRKRVKGKRIVEISAATGEGVGGLLKEVHKICKK